MAETKKELDELQKLKAKQAKDHAKLEKEVNGSQF
jgi:hypothetical protein